MQFDGMTREQIVTQNRELRQQVCQLISFSPIDRSNNSQASENKENLRSPQTILLPLSQNNSSSLITTEDTQKLRLTDLRIV